MKTKQKLVVAAIAIAMTSPLLSFSTGTLAAEQTHKGENGALVKPASPDQALLKFSETGNSAMHAIRIARFDIFNGNPQAAIKEMESAQSFFNQAEKEAPTFDTKITVLVDGKAAGSTEQKHEAMSIPFDGQLLLADNFVMTPEKKAHIDKANGHFRNGDHAKAVEELRLGEIDINYSRFWVPITQSKAHLATAIKLASDNKYYEANLALKAIDDSVKIDTVSLRDLPQRAKIEAKKDAPKQAH
ncbi:MAG: YfdX family protein [Propionivibrio sp.]|nr:YfdX family protein [Propionivibrio sp.]